MVWDLEMPKDIENFREGLGNLGGKFRTIV